jgi:glutamine amidotransferase
MSVAIIDYGSGNLRSAAKAFERAAADTGINGSVAVTSDAAELDRATHIVLPGVGAFADCMNGLASVPGMIEALTRNVRERGKPLLGICVGMQLMASRGLEHFETKGLGWIEGDVKRIEPSDPALKIPHMGWNSLEPRDRPGAMNGGLPEGTDVYFVHSYHLVCANDNELLATTDYGGPVTAIVGRDNMLGTQFHPEKSQAAGLRLIGNFLAWRP